MPLLLPLVIGLALVVVRQALLLRRLRRSRRAMLARRI
jgi:hypothetical protein